MSHLTSPPEGVFAAAVTPLKPDGSIDMEALPAYLAFLAQRGCQGALVLGTTGEGPSFSPSERRLVFEAAIRVRQEFSGFKLLAGTGTPSLEETSELTRAAFELGFDGAVTLPPYYYRKVSEGGLFAWFSQVINTSVEQGMPLYLYHIPSITGIPVSLDLLARLKDAFPGRFAGMKDSSGDSQLCQQLGERFGKDLAIFTGNDRLFSLCLENQGSGCITAMANLYSPLLQDVWKAHKIGSHPGNIQKRLDQLRTTLERYAPFPPILKGILHQKHSFPAWEARLPFQSSTPEQIGQAIKELAEVDEEPIHYE